MGAAMAYAGTRLRHGRPSLVPRLGSPFFRAIIPRMTFDPLGRPALSTCPPYIAVDPTKLKYLAVTVMTAESTASEVRTFSRTCKSRVLCLYREYRAGILVRVNLSISSLCLR